MFRIIPHTETFTILLMVCLFLVATSKVLFSKRFQDFVEIMTHFRYVRLYSREQRFFDLFDAILFGNMVINFSILMYLVYQYFIESTKFSILLLSKIIIILAILILIKVLIERLVGSYLEVEPLISDYLFQKISYKNFLGLLLLPINFILIYSITPNKIILILVTSILILINCIGMILFLRAHLILIKSHIFYFILYLCALEISPYVLLYKVIIDKTAMV